MDRFLEYGFKKGTKPPKVGLKWPSNFRGKDLNVKW